MKPTPFDPSHDLAPIPLTYRLCGKARELKEAGLDWRPHVGCFVWDPDGTIPAPSPFGGRIYFVLNVGRFLQFYTGVEQMKTKLVWIPTWHQARLLWDRLKADGRTDRPDHPTMGLTEDADRGDSDAEFLGLYDRILVALSGNRDDARGRTSP